MSRSSSRRFSAMACSSHSLWLARASSLEDVDLNGLVFGIIGRAPRGGRLLFRGRAAGGRGLCDRWDRGVLLIADLLERPREYERPALEGLRAIRVRQLGVAEDVVELASDELLALEQRVGDRVHHEILLAAETLGFLEQ